MIKNFKLFLESEKPVISFDFDGVMYKSVIDYHPIGFSNPDQWEPFTKIHDIIRKEHNEGNKIVVISARDGHDEKYIWEFIDKYGLPIDEVYCTNDESKIPYLEKVDAVKHYDDKDIRKDVEDIGVEFVLVDPYTEKIEESASGIKTYEFTLRNDKFFISPNTVNSFAIKVKSLDPDRGIMYNERENGVLPSAKIIYMRTLNGIDREKLNKLIKDFENKYDHLKIAYVVK